MRQTIHIRRVRGAIERERAIAYISEHMREKHGACPPPESAPECIFIAIEDTTIVGSLAMEFGRNDAPLPFEQFFLFDRARVPIHYVREKTIYYSRWNSSRPGLGKAVWYAASRYALGRDMIYTAQTIRDSMIARYASFGCHWKQIPDTTINLAHVGETELEYFQSKDRPHPWLGILEEQIRLLPEIVEHMREHWDLQITF